jgi:hypothetical protein
VKTSRFIIAALLGFAVGIPVACLMAPQRAEK